MELNYIKQTDSRNLVRDLFVLNFIEEDLPFKSVILPLGYPTIVFIFSNEQTTIFKGNTMPLKGLTVSGQFYGTYDYYVNDVSCNIGISFNPTSLYKILNKNISSLTNKHILLSEINPELSKKIESIFLKNKNNIPNFKIEIINFIEKLAISEEKDVNQIDIAINYIYKKEGLLLVNDLLEILPYSQKSLELKFKKIVGLTPGRYI